MSPVEKLARALCRREGHPENTRFEGKPMWQSFLAEALVAIDALHITDPNSPVLTAGECTAEQWNRMIEALLAEGIERVQSS